VRRRSNLLAGLASLVGLALLAAACGSSRPAPAENTGGPHGTVVVFAAASLKDTFTALAGDFERAHPGVRVVASFGGSDSLAAQIAQGAPVDVFASADTATMAAVTKAGDAKAPTVFATNELEIAVRPGNPRHIGSLAGTAAGGVKLALCAPAVPCGSAATRAFASAGVSPHPVTLEQNVTAVLTKVELGEVDAGLVYRTDVKSAAGKVDGVQFPQAAQAVNSYPIAVVNTGHNAVTGQAFVEFVLSSDGQRVLQAAGFAPAGGR
jgi:molybdate transport system substrate-binding protein